MTITEQIDLLKAELEESKARNERLWLEFKTAQRAANEAKRKIDAETLLSIRTVWHENFQRIEALETTIRELERFGSL